MKKIISAVMILSLFILLCSCNRKYDEQTVKAEAQRLILASENLNEIFWGKGIEYIDDTNTANGNYREASYSALKKLGFTTIAELEALTRATFSESYADSILRTTISSISDEDGIQHLARYYQKYTDETYSEPECIMVYTATKPLLLDKVEYFYDSIRVTHSKKETVFVEIDCKVVREDGKTQNKTLEIGFLEEENGWRISTPTYTTYNLDYYEELEK